MRIGVIPEGIRERVVLRSGQFPLPLFDVMGTMLLSRALMAAVRFGVFDHLRAAPRTAAELAAEARLDPHGAELLLEALVASGYLEEDAGRYRNSALAARWLLSDASPTLANFVRFNYHQWEWFSRLENFLESGQPVEIHARSDMPEMWRDYMLGLRDIATLNAAELVESLPVEAPRRLLDIGGGHAYYSIAMCRRFPDLRVTVLDLEPAARIGRELVAQAGLADRIEFQIGNLADAPLGEGHDLVFLFNVVHHLDEPVIRQTFARLHAALAPGGLMVVWEPFREEGKKKHRDQLGSLLGLFWGVTSGRQAYRFSDVSTWAGVAGFREIRRQSLRSAPFASLLLARK